ncbi:MAG: hypothetical protein NTW19_20805 [Planctomycetota bacterium]|nr:hypothetical protein [Planctomycetota bacterium]
MRRDAGPAKSNPSGRHVDLFSLYERADLNVAGASNADLDRASNPASRTLEERWALVAEAWRPTALDCERRLSHGIEPGAP